MDLVPALVGAKIRVLQLVRALDAAGVDPREHPELPEALAGCAGLDDLLTKLLEFVDREPLGDDQPVPAEISESLAATEEAIAGVLQMLPPGHRKRVRREMGRVGAAEPEIWLEVEGFRAAVAGAPTSEEALSELRSQHAGAAYLFDVGAPEGPADLRVARQEAKPLPLAYETETWLRSLPLAWLRTIARMHRADPGGSTADLVAGIQAALLDPEGLATVLGKGLGRRERARLAEFVADDEIPLDELPDDVRSGLAVSWDWSGSLPSGVGGRLRAFGLVHVGTRDDRPTAAVPPELAAPIITALREADPEGWRSLDAELRADLEDIEHGESDDEDPYDEMDDGTALLSDEDLAELLQIDPDLQRWRERASEGLESLARRIERRPPPPDAVKRLLAPISAVRDIRDDDLSHLLHLLLFDWPDEDSGEPWSLALLAKTRDIGAKERAILKSRCGERPALYRIESVDSPRGVQVVDAFTGGPLRWVDVPELTLAFHSGDLLPARLFQAGPYCLLDVVGEPVEAPQADEALAWLEERFREYAKAKGKLDREAFLREHPECVTLATVLLDDQEKEDEPDASPHLVPSRSTRRSSGSGGRRKPEKVYVLDIELVGAQPSITRRLQVSGRATLGDLHDLLQTVMGWNDEHLHAFEARDRSWRYSDPRFQVGDAEDEEGVTLDDVAPRKGSRFHYVYDFGDSWLHEIRVAERLDPKKAGDEPWCLGGQNACPPEDSGGVMGYAWKLEALADPSSLDHGEVRAWMGDEFDPTYFDPEDVNRYLRANR